MERLRHLVLTMLAALTSIAASAYDFEDGGIYYNVLSQEDLTCEVTYQKYEVYKYSSNYSDDIVIPSTATCDGKTFAVSKIGEHAFVGC